MAKSKAKPLEQASTARRDLWQATGERLEKKLIRSIWPGERRFYFNHSFLCGSLVFPLFDRLNQGLDEHRIPAEVMYFLDGALRRNSESHSSDAIHSKSFCQFRVFGSNAGLNLPPCLAELDLALNLKRIALR